MLIFKHYSSTDKTFKIKKTAESGIKNIICSSEIEGKAPWTLLFADDLAIVAKSKRELEEKLEEWRKALEDGRKALEDAGLKISRSKTEAMRMGTESEEKVMMAGGELPDAVLFKYLGSMITITADCEKDVESRIGKAWNKWKSLTGVMCDKKMPAWLKGKVYKVMIRPVMTYASETWAIKTKQEKKLDVAEMKMLRWSLGKTRKDKIRNYAVRAALGVRAVSEKLQGNRLRWKSSRTNRNSRKKKAWETNAYVEVENKNDMKDLGLNQAMALDREV